MMKRRCRDKVVTKTKNGKIIHKQNISAIFNDVDHYVLFDKNGDCIARNIDYNKLHQKLYSMQGGYPMVMLTRNKRTDYINDEPYTTRVNEQIMMWEQDERTHYEIFENGKCFKGDTPRTIEQVVNDLRVMGWNYPNMERDLRCMEHDNFQRALDGVVAYG